MHSTLEPCWSVHIFNIKTTLLAKLRNWNSRLGLWILTGCSRATPIMNRPHLFKQTVQFELHFIPRVFTQGGELLFGLLQVILQRQSKQWGCMDAPQTRRSCQHVMRTAQTRQTCWACRERSGESQHFEHLHAITRWEQRNIYSALYPEHKHRPQKYSLPIANYTNCSWWVRWGSYDMRVCATQSVKQALLLVNSIEFFACLK